MPLNLYRRHRKECEDGHPNDSRSGEFEERKKMWKRCACQIFASGTLAGQFKRRFTGKIDWDEAEAVTTQWAAVGNWAGPAPPQVQPVAPAEAKPARISIIDATEAYLARCRNRNIGKSTLSKYRTFVKQLRAYAISAAMG